MVNYYLDTTNNTLWSQDQDGHKHVISSESKIRAQQFYNPLGQLHRTDGPAVIHYKKKQYSRWGSYSHSNCNEDYPHMMWYQNGQLHRIDGPAVVVFSDKIDGLKQKEEWYFEGNLKNITGGPSIIEYTSEEVFERKWINQSGEFHRENGPAREWSIGRKEWYQNGKLHRTDGPASEGLHGSCTWYVNGKRHRDQDEPALIYIEPGRCSYFTIKLEWYKNNKLHRLKDQPASMTFTGIDPKHVDKIKTVDDVLKLGGNICVLEYYKHDKPYRRNFKNPVTAKGCDLETSKQVITRAEWKLNGELHRTDGPALIDGCRKIWYQNGQLHRLDGPAIVDHHPSLNEWWIEGYRILTKHMRPWLKKNNVDLSTQEGQLAFYMYYKLKLGES